MSLINHSLNFKKQVTRLLGRRYRTPIRVAWLTACSVVLKNIHIKFLQFTNAKWNEVQYNGQTFVMEIMLRSKFGEGIYITNNIGTVDSTTIGRGPDWDTSFGRGFDFDSGIGDDYVVAQYNFTVHVPAAISFVQSEMEAAIRKYKLYGTKFNIVII
jgi:hypothetical protein